MVSRIDSFKEKFDDFMGSLTYTLFQPPIVSYQECNNHRLKYNTPLGDNVLLLVHPFYASYFHDFTVKKSYYNQYEKIVYKTIDSKNWSKAWFTFPSLYYEGKTLLESGRFNKVFFTEKYSGKILNGEDISELGGKRLVILGSYAECCVRELIKSLEEIGINNVEYLAEAILFFKPFINNKTATNEELLKYNIRTGLMPKRKIVRLEDIIICD